ncbi:LRIG3 [Branchiostoma lanceolatum]|uniref:LRIG3 protein n=1 Tax=Branchiostoma lanceolatum TaxID=7740 RepID=A0A8J9ZZ50_BRALA|nr:LRIG3 [Branchiostoma lanceolatum]
MRVLAYLIFLILACPDAAGVPRCNNGLAVCPNPVFDITLRVSKYGVVRVRVRCPRPRETPARATPSPHRDSQGLRRKAYNYLRCQSEHERVTLSASLLDKILSEPPTKTQLLELTIEVGSVAEISEGLFNRTPNLCRLTIRENCLPCVKKIWFADLPNLQHLNLVHNGISQIMDGAFELLPKLLQLTLALNKIQRVQASWFRGLTSLKGLDLDKNPLVNVSDTDATGPPFINVPQLGVLHLGYSRLSVLYPDRFMNMTSLRELWLIESGISDIHEGAFVGLVKLRTVVLSSNNITTIRKGYFFGLSSAHSVDLCSNAIAHIEKDGFLGLRNVYFIVLSNNKLTFIRGEWFRTLEKLRTLFLNGNNIYALEAPKWSVDLDNNPLRCSCAFVLFRKRNIRDKFLEYDKLTCMYPAHLQHRRVSNVTMDTVSCPRPAVVFDVEADGNQQNSQNDSRRTFLVEPLMARPTKGYRNKTQGLASRLFQEGHDVSLECRVFWEVAPRVTVTLPGGAVFSRLFKLGDERKLLTATRPVEITISFTHFMKPEGFRDPFARRTREHRVSYLGRTDVALTLHNFTSESAGMYTCTASSVGKKRSAKLSVSLFNQTGYSLDRADWEPTEAPRVSRQQLNNSNGSTGLAIEKDTLSNATQYNTEKTITEKSQPGRNGNQQLYFIAIGSFCTVVLGATGVFVCVVKKKKKAIRDSKINETNGSSNQLSTGTAQNDRTSMIVPYIVHYFLGTPAQSGRNDTTEEPFYGMTGDEATRNNGEPSPRRSRMNMSHEAGNSQPEDSITGEPFYEMTEDRGARNKGEPVASRSKVSRLSSIREEAMSDEARSSQKGDSGKGEPFYEMHEPSTSNQEGTPTPVSHLVDDEKVGQATASSTQWVTGDSDGDDDLIYAFIDDDFVKDATTAKDAGTSGYPATSETEDLQENDEAVHSSKNINSDHCISDNDFNLTQTAIYETNRVDSRETSPKSLRARGSDSDEDVDNLTYAAIDDDFESCTSTEPGGGSSGDGTSQSPNLTDTDGAKAKDPDTVHTEHLYENRDEATNHSASVPQPDKDQTAGEDDVNMIRTKTDDSNGCHGEKDSGGDNHDLTHTAINEDSESGEVPGRSYTCTNPDGWNTGTGAPPDENVAVDSQTDDDPPICNMLRPYRNEPIAHSTHLSAQDTKEEVINIIRKRRDKNDGIDSQESPPTTTGEGDGIADKDKDEEPALKDTWTNPDNCNIGDQQPSNQTVTTEDAATKGDTCDAERTYENEHEAKEHLQSSTQSVQDKNEGDINIVRKKIDTNERIDTLLDEDIGGQDASGLKDTGSKVDGVKTEDGADQDQATTNSPDTFDDEHPYENDKELQGHQTSTSQSDQNMEEDEIKKETGGSQETLPANPRDSLSDYVTHAVRGDDSEGDEAQDRRYTWTKPDGWYTLGGKNPDKTSEDDKPDSDSVFEAENIYENENEVRGHLAGVIQSDQGTKEDKITRKKINKIDPKKGFLKRHKDCEGDKELKSEQAEGRRYTWTPPDGWNFGAETHQTQKPDQGIKEEKITRKKMNKINKIEHKKRFLKSHKDCEDDKLASAVKDDLDTEGRRYTWTPPDGWNFGAETHQTQQMTPVKPNDDQDTYDAEHLYENENEIR